ncbi:ABC transporter permease [Rossellomorea sp. DA94]|uniref:ABC transporter permease n=1 Tax=Rossellomorea sp. DA94 TaxID=3038653 RepID=UPI00244C3C0B|nr:ABC transporter permease [Rossellomorea sp. DA94]WGG45366.1 ABC transporter permease [Rossellomorea sp. DA94]
MPLITSELFKLIKDKMTFYLLGMIPLITLLFVYFMKTSSIVNMTDSFGPCIAFMNIFVIMIASRLVALEYERETIKALFMQPNARITIIYSKYIALILFTVASYLLFSGTLWVTDMAVDSLYISFEWGILLKWIETFIIGSGAFILSIIFRSSAISLTCSLLILLVGKKTMSFISQYTEAGNYSLILNQDLTVYTQTVPSPDLLPLSLAITIILLHLALYNLALIFITKKRDV